jgi:PBP1b-binding outer membrane lipoprotein LpoB
MPETMHLPKDYLAVCGLFMLLGGCVYPRAVAPETNSTATPAPPTTPPSANALPSQQHFGVSLEADPYLASTRFRRNSTYVIARRSGLNL